MGSEGGGQERTGRDHGNRSGDVDRKPGRGSTGDVDQRRSQRDERRTDEEEVDQTLMSNDPDRMRSGRGGDTGGLQGAE
jgi:hypothetical protein